ncbi:MAG: hypothetical protein QM765_15175 [Myxococcales bacterium]
MSLPDRPKAEELGRGLRRVRDSIQKQESGAEDGAKKVWFQGTEPYLDAIFEIGAAGLRWFQVTVRGRSLTWDAQKGFLVTGHTGELAVDGPLAPASKTISADVEGDRAVVQAIAWMFAARRDEAPFDSALSVLMARLGESP